MRTSWRAAWTDPVWSKVIAGLILAAGGAVATWLLDLWPAIGRWFSRAGSFLTATSSLPNWALGLLILLSASFLFLIIGGLVQSAVASKEPDWRDYRKDSFFGLTWRWNYGLTGTIFGLYCTCSTCDYEVHPSHEYSTRGTPTVGFKCDACGSHFGPFDETSNSLLNKVERFIQQRLRTGQWKARNDAL